jgi:hypothetical protein
MYKPFFAAAGPPGKKQAKWHFLSIKPEKTAKNVHIYKHFGLLPGKTKLPVKKVIHNRPLFSAIMYKKSQPS